MLADDHEVVRSGISNALRDMPNLEIVAEVDNGTSLKQQLAVFRPDGLLIDVAMPNFNPITDIREIRSMHPNMRILVVSAHDDDVYVQGLLGAGVNGYHMKDQPLSDLRLAVERVMSGQRWVTGRLLDKLVMSSTDPKPNFELTRRQKEILHQLREGSDNQTIARNSGLSVKTVENHLTRIYRQLGVQSRLEAANFAVNNPAVLDGLHVGEMVDKNSTAKKDNPAATLTASVMVVDDNHRYRKSLCAMLASFLDQRLVFNGSSIAEAVELARINRPQLALIDVVLGNENGIDCTKALMKLPNPPRIVLITAYPDQEFRRTGRNAGAAALLDKKDLSIDVLRQIVADL